jgi:hypothetical protein
MAEIVNLNHFRKARQKANNDTRAARNRARHGRRKDDRQRLELEAERRRRDLDGRISGDGGSGDGSLDADDPA